MSKDNPDDSGELSAVHEELIERFESAWKSGEQPRIEDYLNEGAGRAALLAELVFAELEFRLKAGQDARLEEYGERFPELRGRRGVWLRLACHEFRLRSRRQRLDPQAFAARFPDLGSDLAAAVTADQATLEPRDFDPSPARDAATGETRRRPPPASVASRFVEYDWIARGGMGEVWVARDEVLKRRVAVKMIQDRFQQHPEATRRFLQEAEITSRLEHPGIAPIYGLGGDADGRPCYAMRYIQGESFGQAVRRFHGAGPLAGRSSPPASDRGLSPESAQSQPIAGRGRLDLQEPARNLAFRQLLSHFTAVCQTLAYAHEQGVLHRDLKPENIRLGTHGETIVLDWGLAKDLAAAPLPAAEAGVEHLNAARPERIEETRADSLYGTPQFMSPEQTRRTETPLTRAIDIYGLGATLYYLITGQPPFPRESPEQIIHRVRRGEFPPPRSLCRDTPPALEAICLKAMQLRPEDRYPTASQLADDVERFLADESVSVFRDSRATLLRRWVRRHQTQAATGVTLLAAIFGVLISITWLSQRHARQMMYKNRDLEVAKHRVEESLRTQTELAAALAARNVELREAIGRADRAAADAESQRDEALRRSQQVLGLTRSLVDVFDRSDPLGLRIDPQGGWLPGSTGRISLPDYLNRVVQQVDATFPPDDPARGTILAAVGDSKKNMGLFAEAIGHLREALRIRVLHSSPDDPEAAAIEFNLAWCLGETPEHTAESEQRLRHVLTVCQQQSPPDPIAVGMAQAFLIAAMERQGKSKLAVVEFAMSLLTSAPGGSPIDVLGLMVTFFRAEDARIRRDWATADREFRSIHRQIQEFFGDGHPFTALVDFMMAGYLRQRGDWLGAEEHARRGLKTYRERIGTHTYMAEILASTGQYLARRGDLAEAESHLRESVWLAGLNPSGRRANLTLSHREMVQLLQRQGRGSDLQQFLATALARPQIFPPEFVQELEAMRVDAWLEFGDFASAAAYLAEHGTGNPHLPQAKAMLARALLELGRVAESQAVLPDTPILSPQEIAPGSRGEKALTRINRFLRRPGGTLAEWEGAVQANPPDYDHPEFVDPLVKLASLQIEHAHWDAADATLQRARKIAELRWGAREGKTCEVLVYRALARAGRGDRQGALDLCQQVLRTSSLRFVRDPAVHADLVQMTAWIFQELGDKELARAGLDEVLRLRQPAWPLSSEAVWPLLFDRLAVSPSAESRRDFLLAQLRDLPRHAPPAWRLACLERELGLAYLELKQYPEAESRLLASFRVLSQSFGQHHPLVQALVTDMVRLLDASNRPQEASQWKKLRTP